MLESEWNQFSMNDKIKQILDKTSHDPKHHFGRPFLSAYQIAIEFQQLFPKEFSAISKSVGGKGTGQHTSLAQDIAKGLSRQIKKKLLPDVEGGFLCRKYLKVLEYSNKHKPIQASNEQSSDMSIYRLLKDPAGDIAK